MEEPKVSLMDHLPNGFDAFSGFDNHKDSTSLAFGDVMKCFLLKVVADGADKALKDGKSRKWHALGNQLGDQFPSLLQENVGNSSPVSKTCQVSGMCSLEEIMEEKGCSLHEENKMVYKNSSNFNYFEPKFSEYESVNSSRNPYSDFSLNLPAFLVMLTLKFIIFQFNLAISFLTFPIWFSYFLFTFAIFPLYTLRQIRKYLMRKLLTTLMNTIKSVQTRVQRSVVRLGCALFWSGYVCFVLVVMLALGFLVGGFFMNCVVEEPVMTKETLHFDYTKGSPLAIVPLSSSSSRRAISYNQKLKLTVSLTVPESEYNRKLGVFQVRVEFLSSNGKVTASSSYPCMLRFKSKPLRFIETAVKTAPLLAGFQSESQILNIKTNEFIEGIEATTFVKITLEQRAEHKKGEGIPEVYSASLVLESATARFKRILLFWRRTVFVWVSFTVFLTELVTVLILCRWVIMPRGRRLVSGKKNPI